MNEEPTYVVHFGVYDRDGEPPSVNGYGNPTGDHPFDLDGLAATVSGSWACWGPDDQEDGDVSLHVLVDVPYGDVDIDPEWLLRVRHSLAARINTGARLLDYAIVSERDWSRQHYLARFVGSPDVALYRIERVSSIEATT